MDGELMPGPNSSKSGVNIVRTVYDLTSTTWRAHDINLDFLLDYNEFIAAVYVAPALACADAPGCYESVVVLAHAICLLFAKPMMLLYSPN